jgi:deoxyadenosine/deoxycytidine kinase
MVIYFLESNISGGKTTLLNRLSKFLKENNRNDIEVILEPVEEWEKIGLLVSFYKNPSRWAYTFQNFAFITKYMILMKLDPNKTYIIERSPWTDYHCFAKLCHERGDISEMEMTIYNSWFNTLIKGITDKFECKFIYLKTDPTICLERSKKRNRNGEECIPLEYLKSLDNKHDEWLSNDIIKIDGNSDDVDETTRHLLQCLPLLII